MKNQKSIWIYPLIIMGGLVLINSCKKEKQVPVVNWEKPADISFGTKLGLAQLNATTNVPGSFIYSPVAGTILNEGSEQVLKVDFIPSDVNNYTSISKTVKINVVALTTVNDVEGNVYHSVIIGSQVWMVENLKTTKYNDGTDIPNITNMEVWDNLTTPAFCWYNNDVANKSTNGALYNWFAVNTRKLCPTGWHIPTLSEWIILENYLKANGYNYDGTTINSLFALALALETGWSLSTVDGTVGNIDYPSKRNATGFSAIPSGIYGQGGFSGIGESCVWWSSSTSSEYSPMAYYRGLYAQYLFFTGENAYKNSGMSVRCIKD